MKIVLNKCFGVFSISKECAEYMASLGDKQAQAELDDWNKKQQWLDNYLKNGKWDIEVPENERGMLEISAKYNLPAPWYGYGYQECFDGGYSRTSETLIKAVEHLGDKASNKHAKLRIAEVPDDVNWEIYEYDGIESIHEVHRVW